VTTEDDWQGWCARFDRTHNGVIRLFHDRAIWRTIRAMIDSNPAVQQAGFAENWLAWSYTTTQLIGIRRESGADTDSIGIRRSLKSLASTPRMATRSRYRQQIQQRGSDGEDLERLAESFNQFAAPGRPFADAGLVRADLAQLEAVILRVNDYTTKVLAHRDDNITVRTSAAPPVTWGELDAAINAIGAIHKKYYQLRHGGKTLWSLTPVITPGWVRMFETAWMPPGFLPPDDLAFES
jgi:hypothetical protein